MGIPALLPAKPFAPRSTTSEKSLKIIVVFFAVLLLSQPAWGQTKPVILIAGNGNISIMSTGTGYANANSSSLVASGVQQKAINKHDQTMEMAQDFLASCPAVQTTLDDKSVPDYFVSLNREGTPTVFGELGASQVMVLNAHKSVIFVSKKNTVKNAVKSACNAIAADWQANGRLAPVAQDTAVGQVPVMVPAAKPTDEPVVQPTPSMDVALVIHTTAKADKYCKPQTIASVLNDTRAYLASKGLSLGTMTNSKNTLVLIVDRPASKWIEITIQGQDSSGNILWNEKVGDGGWGHLGEQGLSNTLDKVHKVIDAHLTQQGSLITDPLRQ